MLTTGMVAVLMWAALSFAGFLGHLVGDYLVQNNWMAVNKAKPFARTRRDVETSAGLFFEMVNEPLQAINWHAFTWMLSVALFMVPVAYLAFGSVTVAWLAMLALGVIHWVQDRRFPVVWFMKKTGKDPSVVWLLIVVDNVWHLLQIAGASAFIVWQML